MTIITTTGAVAWDLSSGVVSVALEDIPAVAVLAASEAVALVEEASVAVVQARSSEMS